jgi:AcrR family transcriptional regulator
MVIQMNTPTRKYQLKRRAERQEETRQRIIEATVELHGTVGPAHTSISAIAEKAGVQRLTVYRHFPDERALFSACTAHFAASHPMPDIEPWRAIADPEARLRRGLTEVYRYFAETEQMLVNSFRDAPLMPVVMDTAAPFFVYWEKARDVLAEGWISGDRPESMLLTAIAHTTEFTTWQSLVRQHGLSHDEAIELMLGMVRCLPEPDNHQVQKQPQQHQPDQDDNGGGDANPTPEAGTSDG